MFIPDCSQSWKLGSSGYLSRHVTIGSLLALAARGVITQQLFGPMDGSSRWQSGMLGDVKEFHGQIYNQLKTGIQTVSWPGATYERRLVFRGVRE